MKNFLFFTRNLFKQSILYIILAIDLIGVIITYFSNINIPNWILYLVPVIAFYLASYKLFKDGIADIKITFFQETPQEFNSHGMHENVVMSYFSLLNGYISNLGPKAGLLKSLNIELLEINGIFDQFVIDQFNFSIHNTTILTGKVPFTWYNKMDKNTSMLNFPLIINPNEIIHCFFQFSIEFGYFEYDKIIENANWLKTIVFEISYQIVRGDKVESKRFAHIIKMDSLKSKILEEKERYRK